MIGPAVTEVLNEIHQAPERARAWAAAGGRSKWKEANADAQRLGFYQKEIAPLAAGAQYQAMLATGSFQVQADMARQTAAEAVAKSRSQFEAMVASNKDILKENIRERIVEKREENKLPPLSAAELDQQVNTKLEQTMYKREWFGFGKPSNVLASDFRNYMNAGELAGLGRFEAADRIGSVRQEAFAMQGPNARVMRVKGGLNADMQLQRGADGKLIYETETQDVMLTADALNLVRGQLSTKKIAGNIDDMMITHYGLAEKQFLRGNAEWDMTRTMTGSRKGAQAFVRKDVETDYTIAGHLKMVEGKIGHKDREGQYKTLLQYRNDENQMKQGLLNVELKKAGNDLSKLLATAGVNVNDAKFTQYAKGSQQLQVAYREALDKWAVKQLQASGKHLKLESVFDEAASNGMKKYVEKSLVAPFNIAAQDSKIYQTVQKAATSGMKSLGALNSKSMNKLQLQMNGARDSMDTALDVWFDTLLSASGNKLENMSRLVTAANKALDGQKDNFLVDSRTDRKDEWAYGQYALSKDRYNAVLREIAAVDPKAAENLHAKIGGKTDSRGNIVFANMEIDSKGNIQRDVRPNPKVFS